jgi:Flp pilus assembly protein TadG
MRRRRRLTLGQRIRTLHGDDRGVEVIEFALVSILFCLLVFGIMEFGRAVWIYNTVAHLAKEGARFAMVRGSESNHTATPTDVETYVSERAAGMTGLTVTTTWDDSSKDPGTVVQVQVDKDFDPALPLVGLGPFTLSSTSRMVITF